MAYDTIAVDATSTYKSGNLGTNTFSVNHTVGSGSKMVLAVAVANRNQAVSGITFNSVALTQAVANTTYEYTSVWYLLNPAAGTHAIAVTFGGTVTDMVMGGLSLYNATTPNVTNSASRVGNDVTTAFTPTITGSVALECQFNNSNGSGSAGAGQTVITDLDDNDSGGVSYKTGLTTSASSVSWGSYPASEATAQSVAVFPPSAQTEINKSEASSVSESLGRDLTVGAVATDTPTVVDTTKECIVSLIGVEETPTISEYLDETVRDGLQISIWKEGIRVLDLPEFPGPRDKFLEEHSSVTERTRVQITSATDYADKPSFNVVP